VSRFRERSLPETSTMPIRKWYDRILELIEAVKENLAKADDYNEAAQNLLKEYKALSKKVDTAAAVDGVTMAALKSHAGEFKSLKKDYEKWKLGFDEWQKKLRKEFDDIDDLALKITDRTKELTKDEREHIDKHKQRIAAANVRVQTAINAMVQIEENRFDDKIRAEKKRKKDEGADYDPTSAKIDINASFDRVAVTADVTKKVKLNAAEAKAIDAASKRIEVYEKIREKKLKKYQDIKLALLDFKDTYRCDKIF